jgi:hypothetical protein
MTGRMSVFGIVLGVMSLLAVRESRGDTTEASRLVIYTLRSSQDLAPLSQRLTDNILIHLEKRADLKVIGESEIKLAADYAKNQADLTSEDCRRAAECLAKLAQLAGDANRLIRGHVSKLGESYIATLTLMDAKRLLIEREETCSAESPAALQEAVLKTVDSMLGFGPASQTRFELPAGATKMVVVPLSGLDERSDLTKMMTQLVGYELRRAGLEVWTSDEVFTFMEHTVQREKCKGDQGDIVACLLRFGDALDVQTICSGALGRFDDGFQLILKILDARSGEVLHRSSSSYRGPEAHLPLVVRLAVNEVLGRKLEGHGKLEVLTEVTGTLTIDTSSSALPLASPIGLQVGKHPISIVDADEDYWPYYADAVIDTNGTTKFQPELIERPVPWYRSWWFFTSVGVAVAAGTVTTFLLLQQEGGEIETELGRGGLRL